MRFVWLILFVLVLAAPFALRKMLVPQSRDNSGGAETERLVIVTPHTADIRNEFARAFSAWHLAHYHSAVEIDYRIPGGSNDVKRLLETTYKVYLDSHGRLPPRVPADISLVWGGGDFMFNQLSNLDSNVSNTKFSVLQPLHMTPKSLEEFRAAFPKPALSGVKLYEATRAADGKTPTPLWVGVCLSSFGICYNPDVYRSLQLPVPSARNGWHDLTNPRLAGFIALADPAHSGSSAVAYQMVIQREMAEAESAFGDGHGNPLRPWPRDQDIRRALAKNPKYRAAIAAGWKRGMSELLKIAANARYFTDSSTLVPMDVSRGEAAAGMSIDFYARVTEESVGPDRLQYVAPIDATAVTPDPIAILYGTRDRKLELAEHFIEFLLTREGQRLWILKPHVPGGPSERSLRRMPVRRDVYDGDRSDWAYLANPFEEARDFNQRGEWMALFNDSRPIWVAAWIDSRDELKDAYANILKVADETRRNRLIEELANLPIEMSDVQDVQKQRTAIAASQGDLDEWRARQQIDWAGKFRAHYRAVGAEAR